MKRTIFILTFCLLHFVNNVWQEMVSLRFPAMALVAADALMLATPLEALAETCEADNSVLNMNMPLLLFVALIGATVGGRFLGCLQVLVCSSLDLIFT